MPLTSNTIHKQHLFLNVINLLVMKKCTLYQLGLPYIDEPVAIESMINPTQKSIKDRLLELQMEYWQKGDMKPKVKVLNLTPESIFVKAYSDDIDWSYAVRLKRTAWESLPIQ